MSRNRSHVLKCLTALILSLVTVTFLVAYAVEESSMKVTILNGDETIHINTHGKTAKEILQDADISLATGSKADLTVKDGIALLTVQQAFPVFITIGQETVSVRMCEGTVADALQKAGITLGQHDICNKKADDVLTEESYIDIVKVDYVTTSYEETIPYTTKVNYSTTMKKGTEKVTGGINGVRTVTVKKRMENGVVVDREVVSTNVTKAAVAKTKVIGLRDTAIPVKSSAMKNTISSLSVPKTLKLNEKGIPTSYKKVMTFEATAYTDSSGNRCSTGVKPQTGYIAVNPNIIPYGTKMFIVSKDGRYVYGYAIAADTGGFAKKNPYNVDLFFDTEKECRNFGRRDVMIYFL